MGWKELLGELVALIKTTAPAVWQIAHRQAIAETVECILWMTVLIGFTGIGIWVARYCNRKVCELDGGGWSGAAEEWKIWRIASYVGAGLAGLFATGLLSEVIKRFLNLDYYTISVLTGLIK